MPTTRFGGRRPKSTKAGEVSGVANFTYGDLTGIGTTQRKLEPHPSYTSSAIVTCSRDEPSDAFLTVASAILEWGRIL